MRGYLVAPTVSALNRFSFILIYLLLMLSSISIGIMISLLPLVARTANIPDVLIVSAQAITAGSWIFVAGAWARLARRRGRKFVIMIGGVGLSLGCFATGGVILVAPDGIGGWRFNTPGMYRGHASSSHAPHVAIYGDE